MLLPVLLVFGLCFLVCVAVVFGLSVSCLLVVCLGYGVWLRVSVFWGCPVPHTLKIQKAFRSTILE
jgi:hypothetical protein